MLRVVFSTTHNNHMGIMDEIFKKEKNDFYNNPENAGKEFISPEIKYFLDYSLFHHNWREIITDLVETSKTRNVYIVIGSVMAGVAIVKYLRYRLLPETEKLNLYVVDDKLFANNGPHDIPLNQYTLVKTDDEPNEFGQYSEDEYILKSLFHGVVVPNYERHQLLSLKDSLKLFINPDPWEGKK